MKRHGHKPTSEELSADFYPYNPTYDFGELNDFFAKLQSLQPHESVANFMGFKSKICREDALKLYEMAYFTPGDVLELGSFFGASTIVLAHACKVVGKKLTSVDLSEPAQAEARKNIANFNLSDVVRFIQSDAAKAMKGQYGFVFVDHDHSYEAVLPVCQKMSQVLMPGGFVFFHDYHDIRNIQPGRDQMGVFRAVNEILHSFEFFGIFGKGALFRYIPT